LRINREKDVIDRISTLLVSAERFSPGTICTARGFL
jgi:hypothetical protein